MKQHVVIFFTFSFVVIAGCVLSKLHSDSPLFAGKWVLAELNGTPVQISGTDRDASLVFLYDGMKVTGNGGCNVITGSFKANKNDLSFGRLTTTKMLCPDSKFEDAFLAALKKVNKYDVSRSELVLKEDKTVVAKFIAR